MKRLLFATLAVLIASSALAQSVTFTVPAASVTDKTTGAVLTVPSYPVTVSIATTTPPPVVVTPPPVVTTPPATVTGTYSGPTVWMYKNGVKTLAGDFTANGATTNYANKTSSGLNGDTVDILVSSQLPWLYYLPYWASNYMLPNPGYTYLIFSIKPTITADTYNMHAERVGDNPLPSIALASYCQATFIAGVWNTCKVPLSALGVAGDATLYKVLIQTSINGPDKWEMDQIGFM